MRQAAPSAAACTRIAVRAQEVNLYFGVRLGAS